MKTPKRVLSLRSAPFILVRHKTLADSEKTGHLLRATRFGVFILFVYLVFSVLTNAWAGSFEEANEKYRAGDFKNAAQQYEEILKSGQGTAAVQYNLGNAYLRLGKKAPALVAYERALKADPRNRDIRWNIGVVESMLTDRLEGGRAPWLDWVRQASGWVSPHETGWALLVLVLLLALLGWGYFILGSRFARIGSLQGVIFVVFVLVALLFTFQLREEHRSRAVVLEKEVTLRYGPAFNETKAFVLHEGAVVDVLDESGDWLYASFGKNAGWMPKKNSEIV